MFGQGRANGELRAGVVGRLDPGDAAASGDHLALQVRHLAVADRRQPPREIAGAHLKQLGIGLGQMVIGARLHMVVEGHEPLDRIAQQGHVNAVFLGELHQGRFIVEMPADAPQRVDVLGVVLAGNQMQIPAARHILECGMKRRAARFRDVDKHQLHGFWIELIR